MCADPKAGGPAHFWCVMFMFDFGEPRVKRLRRSFLPLASLCLCAALFAAGCSKEKTQQTIDNAKAAASDAADKAKQKASDAVNTAVQKANDKAQQTASDAAAKG